MFRISVVISISGKYYVYLPQSTHIYKLIDFSLTVKAATLMFMSGHGSAISSAKEGKSGSIDNLIKS